MEKIVAIEGDVITMNKEEKQRLYEEEKRKYMKWNNLAEADLNDEDLENIDFNVEYALKYGIRGVE